MLPFIRATSLDVPSHASPSFLALATSYDNFSNMKALATISNLKAILAGILTLPPPSPPTEGLDTPPPVADVTTSALAALVVLVLGVSSGFFSFGFAFKTNLKLLSWYPSY